MFKENPEKCNSIRGFIFDDLYKSAEIVKTFLTKNFYGDDCSLLSILL